ncbi:amino acid permease [Legionella adelaidensis]|uniref:amino acid permease n=1 Tax=Legionella adelaidensis TaxID=45056 RepID=UPI001E4D3B66|nr:multicopper oxidase domain-containing protein [Legionella adelaidensis]
MSKKLSALGLLWISITSMVGSGWLFGSLYSAQFAGPAAILAWPLAGFLLLFVALPYAELGTMFPQSDSLARLPLYTHGRLTSMIMSSMAWFSLALLPVIETQAVIQYASNYIPNLVTHYGVSYKNTSLGYGLSLIVLMSFVLLNYFGIGLFAKMELFGYMDRFIWMINGLPEYKAKPILIEPGKRYRIIFTNNSMMRHPMHIHGHWFILRNGNNAHDPLLHTIEVPPGATAVADFDSDASGQWFFHCHHIYHMMAGMARVFQYETIIDVIQGRRNPEKEISTGNYINRPIIRVDEQVPIDDSLVLHPQGHHAGFYFASFLDIGTDLFSNTQRLTYKGLYGPDYNKIELFTNDAELSNGSIENADIDIFYWHLISQFWAVKGGVNYFYRPATEPYWQPGVGIEGLMPYFIALDARGYLYNGSAKLDLEISRDTQLTNNFFLKLGVRPIIASKTVKQAAIGNGLNQMRYVITPYYRLTPGVNINLEFEHEKAFGAYKTLLRNLNQATTENTLTIGFSFVI